MHIKFPNLIPMHNTNYRLLCRTNKHNFTVTMCISVHVTGYRAMFIECFCVCSVAVGLKQ